jgi:haloalkane dehalogenase
MKPVPRELYPFDGSYLDVGGVRMHFLDEGEGEPLVCVHGNPTWSFYYREVVRAFRGSHRVVVPDHVGCGLSDKPGDGDYDYTLARRVEDLGSLLDHLALDEINLMVHDWGGAIGLAWAARHPERVRRLIILNTGAFHLPAGKSLPWQLWVVRNTPVGALLVRGFNAFARGATHLAATRTRLPKELRDAYCAPYDSWSARISNLRFVQDIPLASSDPAYGVVTETSEKLSLLADKPILICWGSRDFVFDHHFLAEFRRIFPAAQVREFDDCGHYVLEDAPEEIIELMRGFLGISAVESGTGSGTGSG